MSNPRIYILTFGSRQFLKNGNTVIMAVRLANQFNIVLSRHVLRTLCLNVKIHSHPKRTKFAGVSNLLHRLKLTTTFKIEEEERVSYSMLS